MSNRETLARLGCGSLLGAAACVPPKTELDMNAVLWARMRFGHLRCPIAWTLACAMLKSISVGGRPAA